MNKKELGWLIAGFGAGIIAQDNTPALTPEWIGWIAVIAGAILVSGLI